jgi:hypothetical protein
MLRRYTANNCKQRHLKTLSILETSTYPEGFYTISAQLAVILGPNEFLSGEFE